MKLPERVFLCELSMRDGLQNEEIFIPTETKIFFINAFSEAGFHEVEAVSFANPRYLPQFRDAEAVLKGIKRKNGVLYSAVTVTDRAMQKVVESREAGWGPDSCGCMISTSESHSMRNLGMTHKENWPQVKKWVEMAHGAGMKFIGCVGTTFGCPIEGPVPIDRAFEFVERFLDAGVDWVEIGDTTGEGTPKRVFEFFSGLIQKHKDPHIFIAHFHESRGWGLSNCLAALQAGVIKFDSSLGGIGGQPASIVDRVPVPGTGHRYTPSDITGNVRTEDLVVMLDEMGVETGLDVDRVIDLGNILERVLGRRLRSYCTKTGRIPKGPTGN